MKFLKFITILSILFGTFPYKNPVNAEINNPNKYKISVASYSNENKHRIQLSKGGGQAIRFRYLDEF